MKKHLDWLMLVLLSVNAVVIGFFLYDHDANLLYYFNLFGILVLGTHIYEMSLGRVKDELIAVQQKHIHVLRKALGFESSEK